MHYIFVKFLFLTACLAGVSLSGAVPSEKDIISAAPKEISSSIVPPALISRNTEVFYSRAADKSLAEKRSTEKKSTFKNEKTAKKNKKVNKKGLKLLAKIMIIVVVVVVVLIICIVAFILIRRSQQKKKRAALQDNLPQPMAEPQGTYAQPAVYSSQGYGPAVYPSQYQ